MQLSGSTLNAIRAHMLSVYPNEGCGVIVDGEFLPLKNTHSYPTGCCSFNESIFLTHDVQAVIHSHTHSSNRPSVVDTNTWRHQGKVWGIVSCDGTSVSDIFWMDDANPAPLVGREFIYGYQDCGSIVRDWFWFEHDIRLPDYHRDPEWAPGKPHKDLFTDLIAKTGFHVVPFTSLRRGDVLLMRLLGPHAHHAAVYAGNNQILHQLHTPGLNTLSGLHDLYGEYDRFVVKVVRYGGIGN